MTTYDSTRQAYSDCIWCRGTGLQIVGDETRGLICDVCLKRRIAALEAALREIENNSPEIEPPSGDNVWKWSMWMAGAKARAALEGDV